MDPSVSEAPSRASLLLFWLKKNKRHALTFAFVFGFFFDALTLTRIDDLRNHLIILGYLFTMITTLFLPEILSRRGGPQFTKIGDVFPFLFQFSFGGVLSTFLIYYSRGASLWENWPFLLILVLVIMVNESRINFRDRTAFAIAALSLATLGYTTFTVPILLKAVGVGTFLIGTVLSFFVVSLSLFLTEVFLGQKKFSLSFGVIVLIHILFLLLYVGNIIPPVPLSLQDARVLHNIERTESGQYIGRDEQRSFLETYVQYPTHVHHTSGTSLFFYSAVFAPTELHTSIRHRWQFHNSDTSEWETKSTIEFPISGGRDHGYRGYSQKDVLAPGDWRVTVETQDGRALGRKRFRIVPGQQSTLFIHIPLE